VHDASDATASATVKFVGKSIKLIGGHNTDHGIGSCYICSSQRRLLSDAFAPWYFADAIASIAGRNNVDRPSEPCAFDGALTAH
jgi:hypothetical protein